MFQQDSDILVEMIPHSDHGVVCSGDWHETCIFEEPPSHSPSESPRTSCGLHKAVWARWYKFSVSRRCLDKPSHRLGPAMAMAAVTCRASGSAAVFRPRPAELNRGKCSADDASTTRTFGTAAGRPSEAADDAAAGERKALSDEVATTGTAAAAATPAARASPGAGTARCAAAGLAAAGNVVGCGGAVQASAVPHRPPCVPMSVCCVHA